MKRVWDPYWVRAGKLGPNSPRRKPTKCSECGKTAKRNKGVMGFYYECKTKDCWKHGMAFFFSD